MSVVLIVNKRSGLCAWCVKCVLSGFELTTARQIRGVLLSVEALEQAGWCHGMRRDHSTSTRTWGGCGF